MKRAMLKKQITDLKFNENFRDAYSPRELELIEPRAPRNRKTIYEHMAMDLEENRDKYADAFDDALKIIKEEEFPDSPGTRLNNVQRMLKEIIHTQEEYRRIGGGDLNSGLCEKAKEVLFVSGIKEEVRADSSAGPNVNTSSAEPSVTLSQNLPRNETLVELVSSSTEPPTKESLPEVIRLDSQDQSASQGLQSSPYKFMGMEKAVNLSSDKETCTPEELQTTPNLATTHERIEAQEKEFLAGGEDGDNGDDGAIVEEPQQNVAETFVE